MIGIDFARANGNLSRVGLGLMMPKEKRRHPRFECKGTASVQDLGEAAPTEGRIANLSVDGCLIVLKEPKQLSQDTIVELTFTIDDVPFRVWGQVKAIRSDTSIGFQFPLLSNRVRERLAALIEQLIEDALTKALMGGARGKRRFPRVECNGSASVVVGKEVLSGKIANLSAGGCMMILQAPQCLAPGTTVELKFQVNQLPFRMQGQVKAIRSDTRIGFEFVAVNERVRRDLEDLIEELIQDIVKRFKERREIA
jgi:hypothetical protein